MVLSPARARSLSFAAAAASWIALAAMRLSIRWQAATVQLHGVAIALHRTARPASFCPPCSRVANCWPLPLPIGTPLLPRHHRRVPPSSASAAPILSGFGLVETISAPPLGSTRAPAGVVWRGFPQSQQFPTPITYSTRVESHWDLLTRLFFQEGSPEPRPTAKAVRTDYALPIALLVLVVLLCSSVGFRLPACLRSSLCSLHRLAGPLGMGVVAALFFY
mgnify:CR=1 FL=1